MNLVSTLQNNSNRYLLMLSRTIVCLFLKKEITFLYNMIFVSIFLTGLSVLMFVALIHLFAFSILSHDSITVYLASPLMVDI